MGNNHDAAVDAEILANGGEDIAEPELSCSRSDLDQVHVVYIDTEGVPEDADGPRIRIYLNDEPVFENPRYPGDPGEISPGVATAEEDPKRTLAEELRAEYSCTCDQRTSTRIYGTCVRCRAADALEKAERETEKDRKALRASSEVHRSLEAKIKRKDAALRFVIEEAEAEHSLPGSALHGLREVASIDRARVALEGG